MTSGEKDEALRNAFFTFRELISIYQATAGRKDTGRYWEAIELCDKSLTTTGNTLAERVNGLEWQIEVKDKALTQLKMERPAAMEWTVGQVMIDFALTPTKASHE